MTTAPIYIVHTPRSTIMEDNILAICDTEELAVQIMHDLIAANEVAADDVYVDRFYLQFTA